jgi:hypothetical protein
LHLCGIALFRSNPAGVAAWDENQRIITDLTQNVSSETIRSIFVKLAIAPSDCLCIPSAYLGYVGYKVPMPDFRLFAVELN